MYYPSGKEETSVQEQNISYYDEIANNYDQLLEKDDSNKLIRQKVKEKFVEHVQPYSRMLDFGGGTGTDLEWLSGNNYNIIFCEPSVSMRKKAIACNNNVLHNKNIVFLDTAKTDFTTWHKQLPFSGPIDAILSDFGVINNIEDIRLLFKNLSLIIKPGGHFILIVLELSLKKMLKWHRMNAIRSLIFHTTFVMYAWHQDYKQTVFVHSSKKIKKASDPYFHYLGSEFLGGFGFTLMHLVRK